MSRQLTLTPETRKSGRKRVILEPGGAADELVGAFVDVHQYQDGSFDVRWRGEPLAHRVHDEGRQRVTHAAITENKRLSAVLAHIKAQQDEGGAPPPRIRRASAKNGYVPSGRKPGVKPGTSRLAERRRKQREGARADAYGVRVTVRLTPPISYRRAGGARPTREGGRPRPSSGASHPR